MGETGSDQAGIKLARALKPRLILLDLKLCGVEGFATIQPILRYYPQTRFLIMNRNNTQCFSKLTKIGGLGYINKTVTARQLLIAARQMALKNKREEIIEKNEK